MSILWYGILNHGIENKNDIKPYCIKRLYIKYGDSHNKSGCMNSGHIKCGHSKVWHIK